MKRLSVADFPEPATVLDRVRIPAAFSARSPRHRRDLASTVRNKLAGQTAGDGRGETARASRPAAGSPRRRAESCRPAPPGQPEIARLRRRLRQHPCHACPDREDHARQAERYARLEQEVRAAGGGRGRPFARDRADLPAGLRGAGPTGVPRGRHRDPGRQAAGRPVYRAGPAGGRMPAARPVGRPWPGRAGGLRLGADLRGAQGRGRRRRPGFPAARCARSSPPWSRSGPSSPRSRRRTSWRSCANPTWASPGPRTPGRGASRWSRCSAPT